MNKTIYKNEANKKRSGLNANRSPATLTDNREIKPNVLQRNSTGLSDSLKSGMENLSGISLDKVKVHYNSAKPASIGAHAYTKGTDIHVAPGQEKYVPHEAWHVIQQLQGRVRATKTLKGGATLNDDAGLEKEADKMGVMALQSASIKTVRLFQSSNYNSITPTQLVKTPPKSKQFIFERLEKNRKEKDRKRLAWRINKGKYKNTKDAIEHAVDLLSMQLLFNADRLQKSVNAMEALWDSPYTYEETWIMAIGPLIEQVYTELYTVINRQSATSFRFEIHYKELREYAKLSVRARKGQAQTNVQQSLNGSLNHRQYHQGTSGDPIPITFYKAPVHYEDITNDGGQPSILKTSTNPYQPIGLTSSKVRFPYRGMKLQDMGRSMPRKMNSAVRRKLAQHEYDLGGLEIDHIKDMGFGGKDTTNNLWPLITSVNQRPNSGAWRARYLFHYWDSNNKMIRLASINSPGMMHKYYIVKNYAGMLGTNKNALPSENGKNYAGTYDTG